MILTLSNIILLLMSILCRFITGIFMNGLIREAENMAVTENKFLQQCKVRFRNSYKLNDGIPNIPVFVDRMLGKIRMGRFTVDGIAHLSGQLMLLSVVSAGLGACLSIAGGRTAVETAPYYLLCFLGLYAYFSVSGLVDLDGKRERLRVCLTDYLENHMAPRLAVLDEAGITEAEDGQKSRTAEFPENSGNAAGVCTAAEIRTAGQVFSGNQEKELEELLREFFA